MSDETTPGNVRSNDGLGAFFTAADIKSAMMSELAEARAKVGFCPKCQGRRLRRLSSGEGMVFRECAACGVIVVLGA